MKDRVGALEGPRWLGSFTAVLEVQPVALQMNFVWDDYFLEMFSVYP